MAVSPRGKGHSQNKSQLCFYWFSMSFFQMVLTKFAARCSAFQPGWLFVRYIVSTRLTAQIEKVSVLAGGANLLLDKLLDGCPGSLPGSATTELGQKGCLATVLFSRCIVSAGCIDRLASWACSLMSTCWTSCDLQPLGKLGVLHSYQLEYYFLLDLQLRNGRLFLDSLRASALEVAYHLQRRGKKRLSSTFNKFFLT